MQIISQACAKDAVLPLTTTASLSIEHHRLLTETSGVEPAFFTLAPSFAVGTQFWGAPQGEEEKALFTVIGRVFWPQIHAEGHQNASPPADCVPLVRAHYAMEQEQTWHVRTQRQGYALAWITLSDKGSQGQRKDESGPRIAQLLRPHLPLCHEQGFLLPDDARALQALVTSLALEQEYDIICTTGGTGLGLRDVTPEAMQKVLDTRLPGFEQMMMQASLQKTPHAALSRAMVGLVGRCLCINLPGSVKAVQENLTAIMPALPHALEKIHVQGVDCGMAVDKL